MLNEKYNELPEKVVLIPNGTDLNYFSPDYHPEIYLHEKYDLPDAAFIVTFLGRFSDEKNPKGFIEIARRIPDENIIFFMGGNGPQFTEIQELITTYNLNKRIISPGFIDSRDILSSTNILLIPSILDGRPNIALEALAMGVPVIASDVGGLSSIIENNKNGFLCKIETIEEFVYKIKLLFNDRKKLAEMRTNARAHALLNFSEETMNNKYQECLSRILTA